MPGLRPPAKQGGVVPRRPRGRLLPPGSAMCTVAENYARGFAMRTNVDIDEELLAAAMAATGQTTKKATVEEALRRVVELQRQRTAGEKLAGLGWDGDLSAGRAARAV